jgi:hypothetical protein
MWHGEVKELIQDHRIWKSQDLGDPLKAIAIPGDAKKCVHTLWKSTTYQQN